MADTATTILSVNQLNHIVKGIPYAGKMKITSTGLAFKEDGTDKQPITINKAELGTAGWLQVGRGNQLRLRLKAGIALTFDDITNQHRLEINDFFSKEFDIEVEKKDVNVVGWNWGKLDLQDQNLSFDIEDKVAFELPLNVVSNAQSVSKYEASIEFHTNPADRNGQQIESMRLHFTTHSDDEDEAGGIKQAEVWVNKIMEKADTLKSTGLSIAKIENIMCNAPRARYDFEFHHKFFHMRSKAADYKIKYSSIKQMFKLTTPDRPQEYFVVQLDPPLKHNLKKHEIVTFSMNTANEIDVEIHKPEDSEITEKLEAADVLDIETGPVADILARLLKAMSKKKLYGPSKTYKSKHGNEGIKCNVKNTVDGHLYPLDKSFLFLFKNPVYIRYDQVSVVEFQQLNNNTHSTVKAFNIIVNTKEGDSINFSSIQKEEYPNLKSFLVQKKLEVTTDESEGRANPLYQGDSDDEMATTTGEGLFDVDDEGSSADESFHGSDMGESDVDEEFASDASGSSDSDSEKVKEKKKSKKKGKSETGTKTRKKSTPSSYVLYCQSIREKIKENNPEMKQTEIMKKMGEMWTALTDEEKLPFVEQAAKLREEAPMVEVAAKKKVDADAPPKPAPAKSAYVLFSMDQREAVKAENPEADTKELMKLLGAKWSGMSNEEKQKYVEQAAPDKERYAKEMEAYKTATSGKRSKKSKKDSDKPKQPSSTYILFSNAKRPEFKEKNPGIGIGDLSKLIGKAWQELSDEDKQPFKEEADKLKAKYLEDLEVWRLKKIAEGGDSDSDDEPLRKKAKTKSKAKQTTLQFKSAATVDSDDDVASDD